jgi:hypothetical protein
MREKRKLLMEFKLIWVVQSYCEKYFALRLPQISGYLALSRTHKEGASRSSRRLGAGCGGRFGCALTNAAISGRQSRVVLAPRRWR